MTRSAGAATTRYEPITQIGRGGMAEVLLAMMDAGGGVRRLAVLKRIWPELATDPDFVTMFLDEDSRSMIVSSFFLGALPVHVMGQLPGRPRTLRSRGSPALWPRSPSGKGECAAARS
jgi:hypothetical protein